MPVASGVPAQSELPAQEKASKVAAVAPAHKSPSRLGAYLLPAVAAILALVGVTVFLYPQAAQWVNQYRQAKLVDAYNALAIAADPPANEQIARAEEYNQALRGGGMVDIAGHVPTLNETQANIKTPEEYGVLPYEEQLKVQSDGLMGRIKVPAADVDLPIYHGTSDATLLRGAGHLQGTALPVGGEGTRTVITAHRGLAEQAMFTHLDRVAKGDEFSIEVFDEVLVYRVVDIQVVEPEDVESIRADPNRDLATLITCTPLGINTQRIVVTGERVLPTPSDAVAGAPSDLPHFPWWIVWWLLAFVCCCVFYFYAAPRRKKNAKRKPAAHLSPASGRKQASGA